MDPSVARRLIFYTKEACPLCETGWDLLRGPARRLGVVIDQTVEVPDEFASRLPVVVDGRGNVVIEGRWGRAAAWVAMLRVRLARK